MLYVVLAVMLLAISIAYLFLSKVDFLSPCFIFLLSTLLALFMAIVGLGTWNQIELKNEIFFVTLIGAFAFAVGCVFTQKHLNKKNFHQTCDFAKWNFEVPTIVYAVLSGIIIVTLIERTYEMYQIADEMGLDTSSYQALAKAVRQETATFFSSDAYKLDYGFSIVNRLLSKVVTAVSYAVLPFLATQLTKRDLKKVLPPIIVSALFLVYCATTGGRAGLFMYLISLIAAICMFIEKRLLENKRYALRFAAILVVLGIVAIVAFFFMSFLVGRGTSINFIEYISFYFGCGLPSFQAIMDTAIEGTRHFGELTFYNVYSALYKFGLIDSLESYSIAWVSVGYSSNVFGPFARYYLDFGLVGVVLFSALSGVILTTIYAFSKKKGPVINALYCYLVPFLVDMARAEIVFSKMLSIDKLMTIFFLLLTVWIMCGSASERNSDKLAHFK